jgi:carbamoyltransferase
MNILGINSAYHESAACLLSNGKIVAAVEEERFTRRKHAKSARVDNPDQLPLEAIRYCLDAARISMGEVDYIGYSLDPKKRLENQHFKDLVAEKGWGSADGENEFYRKLCTIPHKFREMGFDGKFLWINHHLCHAASAYYVSPFNEAAVISTDGIGETSSAAFGIGRGNTLRMLQKIVYPASLGFLWEKIAKFIGFSEWDACKVMSLTSAGLLSLAPIGPSVSIIRCFVLGSKIIRNLKSYSASANESTGMNCEPSIFRSPPLCKR